MPSLALQNKHHNKTLLTRDDQPTPAADLSSTVVHTATQATGVRVPSSACHTCIKLSTGVRTLLHMMGTPFVYDPDEV